jgi:hypothetical protein
MNSESRTSFLRIAGVSFLLLFAEITAVRWLGMEVRVIKAFPNLIVTISMIASSAGLIAKPGDKSSKSFRWLLLLSLFFLWVCTVLAQPLKLTELSIKADHPAAEILGAIFLLLSISAALYLWFRDIGKLLGHEYSKLKPIPAYVANLAGSIAGALSFTLISWLCLPPFSWILTLGIIAWGLYKKPSIIACTCILTIATAICYSQDFFSPYSKLTIHPASLEVQESLGKNSFDLHSNNLFFNSGIDINKAEKASSLTLDTKEKRQIKSYFEFMSIPMKLAKNNAEVLILGAGPGNDVAYALKAGATHVDAVEIDPTIARIGKQFHPNQPYTNPRVEVFIEDARTFLRYSKRHYDLVEFAYLDPGNTIDSASLVRVDNFVYTVESMKSVLSHLKPDGVASIIFTCPDATSFIYKRLYGAVKTAVGHAPIAYTNPSGTSIAIIFGPGAHPVSGEMAGQLVPYPPAGLAMTEKSLTDDWPFMYLNFEPVGLITYIVILLVSVVIPALLITFTKSEAAISRLDWGLMFFLGQGFMLMETKAITQLSVLYGATWLVSSIVILFVLIFAFAAALIAGSRNFKSIGWLYCLLAVSLTLGYFLDISSFNIANPIVAGLIISAITCLPVFFGSMVFSICFKGASSNTAFLSANLLGVGIGGLTENICICSGIKSLNMVALFIYGLSYVCWKLGKQAVRDKKET